MTSKRPTGGRQAAHLAARHDGLTLREAAWKVIRRLKRFTVLNIRREVGGTASIRAIRAYCDALERAGYLKRVKARGSAHLHELTLVRDIGVEAPRVTSDGRESTTGRVREDLWRSIRMLKEFSILELVAVTPGLTKHNAKSYLRFLRHAGYVVMGERYRFRILPAMCKGPKAPIVQNLDGHRQVYDPNLRRVTWPIQEAA